MIEITDTVPVIVPRKTFIELLEACAKSSSGALRICRQRASSTRPPWPPSVSFRLTLTGS